MLCYKIDFFMSYNRPISAFIAGLLPFVKVVDNFDAEYEVGFVVIVWQKDGSHIL